MFKIPCYAIEIQFTILPRFQQNVDKKGFPYLLHCNNIITFYNWLKLPLYLIWFFEFLLSSYKVPQENSNISKKF